MNRRVLLSGLGAGLLLAVQGVRAGSFEDFFVAIKRDDVPMLQSLHARGFDLNTPDAQGRHALHLALREPALHVAEHLARHPAVKVDTRNPQDETPLMLAVLKGHIHIARVLLERDADVNKTGWAPLHYAATYTGPHAVAQVQLLLEQHAYIDAESPNGTTPLMMAAQYGSTEVVQLLLEEGADPMLANEQGLRAVDFAVRGKRPSAQELLTRVVRSGAAAGKW